jgi:hypothetical protein
MPNPILLAQNALLNTEIRVEQMKAAQGIPIPLWEISVPALTSPSARPLWILDGQHRVHGMANSKQKANPIPFVLLLNEGGLQYDPALLASLFAQVTTSAEPLDQLHEEWLTFAFGLGDYEDPTGANTQAMTAVAELCRRPQLGGRPNPFCNNIQFNIAQSFAPKPGGFRYTCRELMELFRAQYFRHPTAPEIHRLEPVELATEVVAAHQSLRQVVPAPQDHSVFFGDAEHGQRIMQDAFVTGVLAHLLHHAAPVNWPALLEKLHFDATDWVFTPWVESLGGRAQTTSRQIALAVMRRAFTHKGLEAGVGNLAEYLQGTRASVTLECSYLTPVGRRSSQDALRMDVVQGDTLNRVIAGRTHIRIKRHTLNIGKVTIRDSDRFHHGERVTYPASGFTLDPEIHRSPLRLEIGMSFYGQNSAEASVRLTWKQSA